jgi:hypothetical protein
VQRLVNELFGLMAKTDDARGASYTRNKDAHAFKALIMASRLFNFLAGWARDHVVGRIAKGLPSVRYAPGIPREVALGPERPWDDPELEQIGTNYDFADPDINKRIVRELAEILRYTLGTNLATQLRESFDALLFGQQTELVRPCRKGLKGPAVQMWTLRFRAAEHVAFRRGRGLSKGEAQNRVAQNYGLDEKPSMPGQDILSKWQQRLPQHFDRFLIEDALSAAWNAGTWYESLSKRTDRDSFDEVHLELLEQTYGDAALAADGRRYKLHTLKKPDKAASGQRRS